MLMAKGSSSETTSSEKSISAISYQLSTTPVKVGLIGFPIEQSLSPRLHNEFFRLGNIAGSYSLWPQPDATKLASFVDKVRTKGIRGFNVTIPYKLSILNYLDELDELAAQAGSVNTVVNCGGWLTGYNTDVSGIEYLLTRNAITAANRAVALVGCGGAARAAALALARHGCSIFCIVRDLKSINVTQMQKICDRIYFVQEKDCAPILAQCEIVVNALPPQVADVFAEKLSATIKQCPHCAVIDLNYYPPRTVFMDCLGSRSALAGGLDMLIGQALEAFCLWTGQRPLLPDDFAVNFRK